MRRNGTAPWTSYGHHSWQDDAKCSSAPLSERNMFTAGAIGGSLAKDLVTRYCHKCPVSVQCFAWGQAEHDFSGIAGGALFVGIYHRGARRVIRISKEDR